MLTHEKIAVHKGVGKSKIPKNLSIALAHMQISCGEGPYVKKGTQIFFKTLKFVS